MSRGLYAQLRRKLDPRTFSGMSPKMAAIVGYIVKETRWASPVITALTVTSDGHVLAQHSGQLGFNYYIGTIGDLQRNWDTLLEAADLDAAEWAFAQRLYARALGGRRRR